MPRRRRLALAGLAAASFLSFLPARPLEAQPRSTRLRVTFQPDCFRASLSETCKRGKSKDAGGKDRLDLGPQIAIWIESADRKQFVDTLMVTSLVATRGIGNRPGAWNLPSSPKFPYGKRPMALPVWAHTRGKLYDTVVMQDGAGKELWLGFHELVSSPDPYYCRPMAPQEIDVDAVTCPTAVFNSAKGKLVSTEKSYYPPRNDLRNFTDRDCDDSGGRSGCPMSAKSFADLNDLDAVTTATPEYNQIFAKNWDLPIDLPEGEYALMVEVSKEFDTNASHSRPAYTDPQLSDSGLKNNLGQPSVVYRVPFTLSRTAPFQGATSEIAGYGDWQGKSGALSPPDATISDSPGSGKGRLLVISQPSLAGGNPVSGRVHVLVEPGAGGPPRTDASTGGGPAGGDGGVCPATRVELSVEATPGDAKNAETAQVRFNEPSGPQFEAVEEYEIRYWDGAEKTSAAFESGNPAPSRPRTSPGAQIAFELRQLRAQQTYTVGVRPRGACLDGTVAYHTFGTSVRAFTQLSGCFIATAAFGSPLAKDVDALRRVRDRAQRASAFAGAVVDTYERSSPPVADLLAGSESGRAVVRTLLAPFVQIAKTAEKAAEKAANAFGPEEPRAAPRPRR
jgi:hypothetical protein